VATTFTTNFGFDKPAISDTGWGGIRNTNMDDLDAELFKPRIGQSALTWGATTTVDLALARVFSGTNTQISTIAFSNVPTTFPNGAVVPVVFCDLLLTNGGAFAITWPASVTWLAGQAPVLQAAGVDVVELVTRDGGTTWYARLLDGKTKSASELRVSSKVFVNDDANANMTVGLTLNQGANDDEILALKSSDIAHGMTTLAETDTYATFAKFDAAEGGVQVRGYTESDKPGVVVNGTVTTGDTTKAISSKGTIRLAGTLKSGTGIAASIGANANILVVTDTGVTRFILDADGDSHQDVGTAWTNFDNHDDVALLTQLSVHVSRPDDPIRTTFASFLEANRNRLEALKLATFNEDGHHFVNWSRVNMLLVGAVRQLHERLATIERRLLQA